MTRLLDLTTLLLLSPHLHLSFLSLPQLPFRHPTGCVFLSNLRDAPVHVMVTRKSRIDWLATSLVYEKVSDLEAILALPGLLPNRRPQNLLSYRLFDLGEHSKSRSSAPGSANAVTQFWTDSELPEHKDKKLAERTAIEWFHRCGYSWKDLREGMYKDGHERPDVVAYRNEVFLPQLAQLEPTFVQFELLPATDSLPERISGNPLRHRYPRLSARVFPLPTTNAPSTLPIVDE